tara:strand:+ start:715 stop:1002 length:288 start_codon:yes stop_codon:yes gene_type:complete
MTIKLYTLDFYIDNEKHLLFLSSPEDAQEGKQEKLAESFYKQTNSALDITKITTHEFEDEVGLANFLNANTTHLTEDQLREIEKDTGLEQWLSHR